MTLSPSGYRRLNPEFKAKWLAALRSGDYEQSQNALTYNLKTFCCLGVACDVMDPTKWEREDRLTNLFSWGGAGSDTNVLPFIDDRASITLIGMNDDADKSFLDIADWIEENL